MAATGLNAPNCDCGRLSRWRGAGEDSDIASIVRDRCVLTEAQCPSIDVVGAEENVATIAAITGKSGKCDIAATALSISSGSVDYECGPLREVNVAPVSHGGKKANGHRLICARTWNSRCSRALSGGLAAGGDKDVGSVSDDGGAGCHGDVTV